MKPVTLAGAMAMCLAHVSFAAPPDAKPKRETVPIGGDWNLSAVKLERAKMDGKRVVQLIAKGDAKLKRGRNSLIGPWTMEASADVIECDFPGKKFVVRGPYSILRKERGGRTEITASGPESSAEVDFREGAVRAQGPSRVKVLDDVAARDEKKATE